MPHSSIASHLDVTSTQIFCKHICLQMAKGKTSKIMCGIIALQDHDYENKVKLVTPKFERENIHI